MMPHFSVQIPLSSLPPLDVSEAMNQTRMIDNLDYGFWQKVVCERKLGCCLSLPTDADCTLSPSSELLLTRKALLCNTGGNSSLKALGESF